MAEYNRVLLSIILLTPRVFAELNSLYFALNLFFYLTSKYYLVIAKEVIGTAINMIMTIMAMINLFFFCNLTV